MTFAINLVGPNGEATQLQGEALPLHEKLPPPAGLQIELSQEDQARFQKGYARLLRAAHASEAVGHFSINFRQHEGFTIDRKLDERAVKFFALECRPFFLEKDPLAFGKLLNAQSLTCITGLRPWLKRLRQRWEVSAFGGVMSIQVNGTKLDTHHVVQTWFNCDIFHSEPQKPEEFSLEQLHKHMGGEQQALGILAHHLWASCLILSDFFEDVAQMNPSFLEAALAEKKRVADQSSS